MKQLSARQRTLQAYTDAMVAAREQEKLAPMMRALALKDLYFLLLRVLRQGHMNQGPEYKRDWLFERCREVQAEPDNCLDLWAREHYKALDVETPIWTSRGWKRHGALAPGDWVFAPNGCRVHVIANTGVMEGADCYDVGGVVAAGDHLWPSQIKHRMRLSNGHRHVTHSTEKVRTADATAIRLPPVAPLRGPSLRAEVPPYVLGVWLGDGHSACGRVTSGDEELWSLLDWPSRRNAALYLRNLVGLMPRLRAIGVLGNKHVPQIYWQSGAADRLALLQGLMDTDGTVNERGTATFVNTNERLIDATAFLARSLGMRAHVRRYRGFWQVGFQAYQGSLCPFRLTRKRERCKTGAPNMRIYKPRPVPTRPTNCIQVEGGLYLAGREMLPTCNSTVVTFGLTIQDVLNDPEMTIGIFSFNRPTAKAFLTQIKREMESNNLLKQLFPEILWSNPSRDAPKWSENDGIIVKRKTNPKEATIEAWGLVDGQPTSKHYQLMLYDDIITRDSVTTPDMIRKVTEAWELSMNLMQEGGKQRYVGTHYHAADTYQTIKERGIVKTRIHSGTGDGTALGEPVMFTPEYLALKRQSMSPYVFSCQILLNPRADSIVGFDEDWIRYWKADRYDNLNIYLIVDPASSKKRKENDYTVMMVIGLGPDDNYYWIDGVRDRLNLTEKSMRLFHLHRQYRPIAVGYEEYGLQADIEFLKLQQEKYNYRFKITPLAGRISKADRIEGLVPVFDAERFFLPEQLVRTDYNGQQEDLVRIFIHEEFRPWPYALHDDMLDAMARILDPDLGAKFPCLMMPVAPLFDEKQNDFDPLRA